MSSKLGRAPELTRVEGREMEDRIGGALGSF